MFARRIIFWVLAIGLVRLFNVSTGQANLLIWYDAEKQAIGVNPYADGWGLPEIAIDFNSDHSSAGVIYQRAWGAGCGDMTHVSVYQCHGGATWFYYDSTSSGFCENYPAVDVSLFVTEAAAYGGDMIRYFVDEWNVAESRTTIYVQPTNANHAIISVLESDLLNVSYALVNNESYVEANWSSIPEPATLLLLGLGGLVLRLRSGQALLKRRA